MGFAQNGRGYFGVRFIIVVMILGMSFVDEIEATRTLKKDQAWLWLESLPRIPVAPSGPSPCTSIPGHGNTGSCHIIKTMDFSDGRPPHVGLTRVAPPPPPPPSRVESNE